MDACFHAWTPALRSSVASAATVANRFRVPISDVFQVRDLFRSDCQAAWIWSLVSVLLLLPLVVVCGLFVSLLVEQGKLSINLSAVERDRFEQLTGLSAGVVPVVGSRPTNSRTELDENVADQGATFRSEAMARRNFEESGILPAVWDSRDQWWGPLVAWAFRHLEWFQSNVLAVISLLMLAVLLASCRSWSLFLLRLNSRRASLISVIAIQKGIHHQVLRLGPEDLDGSGMDLAIRLASKDAEDVRAGLIAWTEAMIRVPLELLCLVAIVSSIHPLLAAQTLLLLVVMWYLLDCEQRDTHARHRLTADRTVNAFRDLIDGFRSARLIRGAGIEQTQQHQYSSQLSRYRQLASDEDVATEQAAHPRTRVVAMSVAVAAFLLFLLATNVMLGQRNMTAASGGIFVTAWGMAVLGVLSLRPHWGKRHATILATENIQRYLQQAPTVGQAVGSRFIQPLSQTLHLDSVSFRMPSGRILLDEIQIRLDAGRTYSLVSINRLEARTLALLLPRFIEPQQGRILFDGEDIAWATLESLRAETIFIGADDPPLFGSVLENIRLGRAEYTPQQVADAAKTAHAHNFIVKLASGYDTILTGSGDSLDAGQRFRISLARAILQNPATLIIEEPSAVLDDDTKALLVDTYDRVCSGRTVFFLPTRLSTVRRSDQIIVLHEGRVAAFGNHANLVSQSSRYQHWEYLNFNEFRNVD